LLLSAAPPPSAVSPSGAAFGFDGFDKPRRQVCGQALNDIDKLQDLLLSESVNLVVQQFDFEFCLHIDPTIMFCMSTIGLGVFRIVPHFGRYRVMSEDESLGSYATPRAAVDELCCGTLAPRRGIETSQSGLPANLSDWNFVLSRTRQSVALAKGMTTR
jgi:hypothetical protein